MLNLFQHLIPFKTVIHYEALKSKIHEYQFMKV